MWCRWPHLASRPLMNWWPGPCCTTRSIGIGTSRLHDLGEAVRSGASSKKRDALRLPVVWIGSRVGYVRRQFRNRRAAQGLDRQRRSAPLAVISCDAPSACRARIPGLHVAEMIRKHFGFGQRDIILNHGWFSHTRAAGDRRPLLLSKADWSLLVSLVRFFALSTAVR